MSNKNADYRKFNDRTLNSSKYHKKDVTNIRAKLKNEMKICGYCNKQDCECSDFDISSEMGAKG